MAPSSHEGPFRQRRPEVVANREYLANGSFQDGCKRAGSAPLRIEIVVSSQVKPLAPKEQRQREEVLRE